MITIAVTGLYFFGYWEYEWKEAVEEKNQDLAGVKTAVIEGLKIVVIFSCTKEFPRFSAEYSTLHKNKLVGFFCFFFCKSLSVPCSSVALGLIECNNYTWQLAGNLSAISGTGCCRGKMTGHVAVENPTEKMASSFKHGLKCQCELFCSLLSCLLERNLRSNSVTKSSSWLEKSELSDWGSL